MIDIPGYEGLYAVTQDGDIYTYRYKRLKIPANHVNGYKSLILVDLNGNKKGYLVHRLVAQVLVPNPHNKPFVNHIDGDKTNHHPSNLEWVTRSENMRHAFRTGLLTSSMLSRPGKRNGRYIHGNRMSKGDEAKGVR